MKEYQKFMKNVEESNNPNIGFWEAIEIKNYVPQSRESGRMCIIKNTLYLMGGYAREPLNDICPIRVQNK